MNTNLRKYNLIFILAIILMIPSLFSCANSKLNKYNKYLNKSMDSVTNISINVQMKDQEVIVYKYLRNLKLDGNNMNIEITESTLSSNFVLEDKVTTENVTDVDRAKLNSIKLSKELLTEFTIKNSVLNAKVSKENISSVLGSNSLNIYEDALLILTYEKKLISKIECSFKTESLKEVNIIIDYSY